MNQDNNIDKESIFNANNYPLSNGVKLIEASAGTGKTFSLAHLVLRLLTENEISIHQILIVSFTKATAAEIKSIISRRISLALKFLIHKNKEYDSSYIDKVLIEWLNKNSSKKEKCIYWSALLSEALDNIDQADITTIHGFCYRTIKRNSIQIGYPMLPVIEENTEETIRDIVFEYWKKEVLTLHPKDIKGIKKAGINIDKIIDNMHKLENDPSTLLDIKEIDYSITLIEHLNSALIGYWEDFITNWNKDGLAYELYLRNIAQSLRENGIKDTKPYSPKPKNDRFKILSKWIDSFSLVSKDNIINKTPHYIDIIDQKKILADYYHPDNIYFLKKRSNKSELISFTSNLQESIRQLWDGPAEIVLNHALVWCIEKLKQKRIESGEITNGDLLKALDPQTEFREKKSEVIESKEILFNKLRLRYQAVLVDEFQDTDPLQWRFLKHVFGNDKDHLLLMIGDPKQAIYKFRGGNLNTYMNARSEVERIDVLKDNYRTTPTLMDALNKLMQSGLNRSGLKVNTLSAYSKSKALRLTNKEYPLQLIIIDYNLDKSEGLGNHLSTKSQLEKQIPNIISNYIIDILQKYSTELVLKDICILVNNHKQAESIRSALSNARLPCNLINKGDILKTEAGLILQRFLNCLAYPSNSNNLRLIACSALVQWTTVELKEAGKNGELDNLASKILYWSQNIEKLGLSGCLSELLKTHTLADLSIRGKLLNDIQQCAQLVQEEIHRQSLSAKGAAKWLYRERHRELKHVPEERQPNSDVDENSIKVITIHKSKGLQYDLVICPYLWQAPVIPKGPLWRVKNSHYWLLSMGKGIRGDTSAETETLLESQAEFERLAYVALTRARKHLTIVWGRALKQEGNPLINFLFNPGELNSDIKSLTKDKLKTWLDKNNVPITIKSIRPSNIKIYNNSYQSGDRLFLGPRPTRKLDKTWGRFSYSSWITSTESSLMKSTDSLQFEEGRDTDQQDNQLFDIANTIKLKSISEDASSEEIWKEENPLSIFPSGPSAGDCLHKILEQLDFQDSIKSTKTTKLINQELSKAGFDIKLLTSVQHGLERVLNVPMKGPLGGLKLSQINRQNRIHELKFDLPLSLLGKPINSVDLCNVFKNNPKDMLGDGYSKRLLNLNIHSKGFLTGSIDLVFADTKDHSKARWWIADWKSNWLGVKEEDYISCGPHHYNSHSMTKEMYSHHYPLQAHLYLVALHRLLKWRLPNYSPDKHLGGYVYIFLRGIPGEKLSKINSNKEHTPGLIIEEAPIQRILEINKLIERGGQ